MKMKHFRVSSIEEIQYALKYLLARSMGGSNSTGNGVERVSLDHGTRFRRGPRLPLSEVDVIDDELTGLSTRE